MDTDLKTLTAEIARILGWIVEQTDSMHDTQITDGCGRLYFDEDHGRLNIRAGLPNNGDYRWLPYGENLPRISVTIKKTPAQIAADIRRRVIPIYRIQLEKMIASRAEHVRQMAIVEDNALHIANLLNEPPPEVKDDLRARMHVHMGTIYGTIEVGMKDVDFDLDDLPLPLAAMIACDIGTWLLEHPQKGDEDE